MFIAHMPPPRSPNPLYFDLRLAGLPWSGPAAGRRVEASFQFDEWLQHAVLDTPHREEKLKNWAAAPGAMQSHPEDEHFLPLLIAAGAAKGEPATLAYSGEVHGTAQSGYRFG